jgi:hypothetical protein
MWELAAGPITAVIAQKMGMKIHGRERTKDTLPRAYFEELEELALLHSVTPIKSDLPQTDEPTSESTVPNNTNLES